MDYVSGLAVLEVLPDLEDLEVFADLEDLEDLEDLRLDSWMALRTFSLRAALLMPTVTLSKEPSSPEMKEVPLPLS